MNIRAKIKSLIEGWVSLRRETVISLLADPGTVFDVETELDAMLADGSLVEIKGEYYFVDKNDI